MTAKDQAAKPLKGRVALVTGASSGIGEATAFALAGAGARTAIVARRAERLAAVAERIAEAGGEALALAADAALESEAKRMLGEVENRFGRLDILVNNAGVMLLSPVAEAEIADFRRMIEINLFGLMTLTRLALPIMKRGGAGHFVNISSVAGRVANPGSAGYAATKFGVGAFSESLRREVYKDKIRVTVIEPGAVATELADHIINPGMKAAVAEMRKVMTEPMQPEDIAAAVLYAVTQHPRVNVNEILIRPTMQER
ncbi:MAG TPA: SDR family NAD(P)-dependent oxidoreductase [Roseiarcus sp.]|jgi:NADP-dependent 3-hydroxy acid dehydrogenase YdfG|nr:SDR family NAD(P)-dependent oxidoreductase [Roseiarcus sp.]